MTEQLSDDFNLGKILENLNNKVDIDLNNVGNGEPNVDNLGNLKTSVTRCMVPSDKMNSITATAGTTYEAPADGFFAISSTVTNIDSYYLGSLNHLRTGCRIPLGGRSYFNGGGILPVRKGDKVSLSKEANVAVTSFKFVYAEGAE